MKRSPEKYSEFKTEDTSWVEAEGKHQLHQFEGFLDEASASPNISSCRTHKKRPFFVTQAQTEGADYSSEIHFIHRRYGRFFRNIPSSIFLV